METRLAISRAQARPLAKNLPRVHLRGTLPETDIPGSSTMQNVWLFIYVYIYNIFIYVYIYIFIQAAKRQTFCILGRSRYEVSNVPLDAGLIFWKLRGYVLLP